MSPRTEFDPRREPLPPWMRQSQAPSRASEVRQALTDAVYLLWTLFVVLAFLSLDGFA